MSNLKNNTSNNNKIGVFVERPSAEIKQNECAGKCHRCPNRGCFVTSDIDQKGSS